MKKRNIWTIIKNSFRDKLKVRVIFITILTVLCSGALLVVISNLILNKNYLEMEQISVTQDLARIDQALLYELTTLDTITIDWGAWEDTYVFVQDANETYINDNFTASTFDYLNINLIAVVNTSGEIVSIKCYELENLQEIAAPADFYQYLASGSITGHNTIDSSYSGILPLSNYPMLFASRPILTDNREGPVRGAFIMGKFLTDTLVNEISSITVLPLQINPYENNPLSVKYSSLSSLSKENPVVLQPLNSEIISGHSIINDFLGEPCLVASIEVPRTVLIQGKMVLLLLYAGIFLTSLLLILVNIRFLESSVFNRLFSLGKSAEAIGLKGDFSSRISIEGHDELALLAEKMNLMLSNLAEVNENLKESQVKYSTIVEESNDGVIIATGEKVKYVNPKTVQIVGEAAEKCIGRSLLDFVSPEDRPIVLKNYTARMEGQPSPDLYEINLLHSSGSIIPVEINARAIDIAGEKNDMIMVRDISERKMAEKKLMAQKEMISRIIASTPNSFIVVDSGHRIVLANETFHNTFIKADVRVEGRKIEEIITSEELHYQIANAFLGVLSERPVELRYEIDGQERIFTSHIIKMENEILLIVSDVTEERLRQESLMVTDRLASIGEMASGIAHEINNPLTGVVGFSQLLIKKNIPQDIRDDLETINHEAQRAAKIVSGLLTFAYQSKPGWSMVDMNEILLNTLELRTYEMELNNIRVVKKLAKNLPLTTADSAQIQQVFLNIILNAEHAIKTSGKKGTLTVTTSFTDKNVIITFSDTGPGISQENLSRIFNPFFTTKKVGEGTGLGLSMSHGIIKQHNGNIYAESKRGRGAKFVVELPIVQVSVTDNEIVEKEDVIEWNAYKKGLLVDDEMVVLRYLSRLLSDWGYTTDMVRNAKDAIAIIQESDYDFILLDVKMPDMDGISLYGKLVQIKPELAEKIIFVTGDVLERTTREFFIRNNIRNITKPIDIDKLKQSIDGIVKTA
jgi:PAS domain S-box-containing protein